MLLGVIVLRGIFLWMVLLLIILGKLNKNTHCSFHQTLHGVSNILQWLSLYTPKYIFYLRGDKFSENLQKRGVWNFQLNGDSQYRGFEEHLFLVNSTKTFIFILVVKHITCNTKVDEIVWLGDFFQKNYSGSSN